MSKLVSALSSLHLNEGQLSASFGQCAEISTVLSQGLCLCLSAVSSAARTGSERACKNRADERMLSILNCCC